MQSVIVGGRTRTQRTFAHWLRSLLGLIGLLLGIPVALIACHAVPPFAAMSQIVDHPGTFVHYLDRSMSDTAVARLLASAAWTIWLWTVVCVVIEVVANLRGRPPLHLPASRHVQSFAAALVGASLAVLPLGRDGLPIRLLAAPTGIQRVMDARHIAPRIVHSPHGRDDLPAVRLEQRELAVAAVVEASAPGAQAVPYVVKPGDTLWSIAEHQLGSPLRWPEIAALNYGRPQTDGEELTDAHWILPGWEFILPSVPTASAASTGAVGRGGAAIADPLPAASVRVDHPSSVPPEVLEPGSTNETDVTVARPGESVEALGSGAIESNQQRRPDSGTPIDLICYGVLGFGVIALLERLRRVQGRHRPRGLRIALPEGDLAELEKRLRIEADPQGVEVIDLGLRALVAYSLQAGTMPPRAALVRLRDTALEIVLDPNPESRLPLSPFAGGAGGNSWWLPTDQTTVGSLREDPAVRSMDAPFPALVTIGRDESGLVLIDLEQAGSIDITGTRVHELLGTMAVEVGTAQWADQVDLTLVGFDRHLETLERVSHVSTMAEVLARAQRRVRERRALLSDVGRVANWEIRWTDGGDSWDLCLVVCAPAAVEADPEAARELVRLTGDGGMGLAVVLGSSTDVARWHLAAHDQRIEMTMNGTMTSVARAEPPATPLSQGVATLVRVANQLEGVPPTDPPYDELVKEADQGDGNVAEDDDVVLIGDLLTSDASEPSTQVEVRVLGPVEIVGAARPFTRAWAIELIVYLAMHRNGASSEQWATALWPDRIMAAASLHSTASAARRSLGESASGEDHLPRAHGRLALGASVRSDWSRFQDLSERPDPASWQQALELIRGRPFDGLRASDWVLLEGIAANVEAIVVDLASRYAEHCLSVGDPGEAEWAARKGLLVSIYDERLYRLLLRVADAAGNPAGVESVMSELVRLVAEDVEPYDAVHPETLDLYRSLSRRSTPFVHR